MNYNKIKINYCNNLLSVENLNKNFVYKISLKRYRIHIIIARVLQNKRIHHKNKI